MEERRARCGEAAESTSSTIHLLLLAGGPDLCRDKAPCATLDAIAVRGGRDSQAQKLLASAGRAMARLGSDNTYTGELARTASAPAVLGLQQRLREVLAQTLERSSSALTSPKKWDLLDATRFVSYGALMRHRVPGEAQGGAGALVLASMSGAPMLATKRYTLTEMNLWLMGDSAAAHGNIRQQEPLREGERGGWLGYDVSDSDCALYRQRRSLKSALLMAQVLRRSLLLPKFCSHTDGGRTVPMSSLFDYERFAAQFPEHAEASALRYFKPGPSLTTAQPPPRFHIALHDASGKKSAEELNVDGSFKAKSPKGASEGQIHTWLKRWQTSPLLWFDKIYQRFNRLDNVEASNLFDVKMRDALQGRRPSAVIDQIVNSLKRDVLSGAGFNCLKSLARRPHKEPGKGLHARGPSTQQQRADPPCGRVARTTQRVSTCGTASGARSSSTSCCRTARGRYSSRPSRADTTSPSRSSRCTYARRRTTLAAICSRRTRTPSAGSATACCLRARRTAPSAPRTAPLAARSRSRTAMFASSAAICTAETRIRSRPRASAEAGFSRFSACTTVDTTQ